MYDWLKVEELSSRDRYAAHSRDVFDSVLDVSEKIAAEKFGPLNRMTDLEEPEFVDGEVKLPEGVGAARAAYAMLTYANANLLMAHGSDAQKRAFALPQLAGRYFGTMCLSEPSAGSSLGDITTRALPDGDDYQSCSLGPRYRIKGSKMWISEI